MEQRRWRTVHPGVYATNHAPLTRLQCWMAATLTAEGTALSHASAAGCLGMRPHAGAFETVVRSGDGGPRRVGALLVHYSTQLDGDVTIRDGIRLTTPARTLIDLAPHLPEREVAKAVREAIRLKLITAAELQRALKEHRRRRGTHLLSALVTRYALVPIHRTRSDAEAYALELLAAANVPPPRVNRRIAGEEADLSWPAHRLIIEIDGPQYHRHAAEDARKQALWERAGWRVLRISSDDVFDRPPALLELAPAPAASVRRAHPGGNAQLPPW